MLDTLEPRPKQKLRPEPRKYTPPLAIPNDSKESPFNFLIFCRRRISKNPKGSLFFTYFGTVTLQNFMTLAEVEGTLIRTNGKNRIELKNDSLFGHSVLVHRESQILKRKMINLKNLITPKIVKKGRFFVKMFLVIDVFLGEMTSFRVLSSMKGCLETVF